MASKEVTLSSLYSELNRFGQNGEYERALKVANKILSQSQDEEEAFHCKVVCLIQLSRFQDALQAITKQTKLSKNLLFEKAYCQYRLNQPAEALRAISTATILDQKLRELKAQILYRLELYEECFDEYKNVIKNSSDEYEDEREANLSAVIANLYIIKSNKEVPKLKEHTFELAYNAACQLVGKGLFIEAEKKLKIAEKLCKEALEEDGASEEDIESEVAIIRGQLAYCIQMQGREKEAQTIYNAILKSKPSDIGLVAVASNNSVSLNRDQNLFDSKKKIKSATAEGVEHKLTTLQRKNIAFNQCLLTVYTNQVEHGKYLCQHLSEMYPDYAPEAILIQAVQLSRDNKIKEAADLLKNFAQKHKERELEMKLACVQLLLSAGEKKEACRIFESLGENGIRPGIISALVTLYLSDDNRAKASEIFKNAVEWYKHRKQSNQGDLSALWRQAADFHLRSGEPQVAANSLEELLRLNPSDNKTLAQLVIAYAQFDSIKAQNLSKQLPQLNLSKSADIELLENSNWMMGTKVIKKVAKVEASPKPGTPGGDELIQKKKKTKKRKGKLPKNFDPDVLPDPERWLPKHQRTGWKKKKDRRNRDIGKGTQGAATGASDMYDITKMPSLGSKNSPNPNSPIAESQGPRQQKRKFQQKKKKKGGRCHFEIWQHCIRVRQHNYYSTNDGDWSYGVLKLESYLSNSRLTLQDSDFVDYVESDIRNFLENLAHKRVLVFPPFSNFRRYLIHQVVETHFENLKSFSIGEGDNRRTVVCFDNDYKPTITSPSDACFCVSGAAEVVSVQPSFESAYGTIPENRKRVKRARTMPSVSIYRPPAARKLEQNAHLPNLQPREMVGTSSPGKNKFRTSEDLKEISQTGKRNESDGISVFRNAISSIRTQNKVPKCKNIENANKKIDTESKITNKTEEVAKCIVNQNKQRRPDMQVYVPKGRRTASFNNTSKKSSSPIREEKSFKETEVVADEGSCPQVDFTDPKKEADTKDGQLLNNVERKVVTETSGCKVTSEVTQKEPSKYTDPKITSFCENFEIVSSTVKNGHTDSEKISESKSTKKVNIGHLNPEEDDWEAMYDDTGECLDPSLLDQLTNAVGEVTLEKPKSSYNGYKTKSLDTVADEFPHVIEIYNFPPEFQLQDLMMVFSQFKNSGFEIKWVDDTHALGIFSSSVIVSEVLDFYHPFVKTRSLKDGTFLSKMKARRSAEFLLPYKPRPETCSALARRLVTGALGVRLPTSRQEREAEKQILTKAREKKRLEAKQKEDAWEGTFS